MTSLSNFLGLWTTVVVLGLCPFVFAACDKAAPLTAVISAPAVPAPTSEPHFIVVELLDTSEERLVGRRCQELRANLNEFIEAPPPGVYHLIVLQTGDQRTAGEPVSLFDQVLRPQTGAFEDPASYKGARIGFAGAATIVCESRIAATHASPIYRSIARGIDLIRARCDEVSKNGGECVAKRLNVHSDLRERGGDPLMEKRLAAATKSDTDFILPMVPRLPSGGIDIHVCGTGDIRGASELPIPVDALTRAWSSPLGAGAPLVFDPNCKWNALNSKFPPDRPFAKQEGGR
jgi:hypothetical protein